MLEMAIFAVVFVVAQVMASLILMKLFMSKAFIKKTMKMYTTLVNEAIEEIDLDKDED